MVVVSNFPGSLLLKNQQNYFLDTLKMKRRLRTRLLFVLMGCILAYWYFHGPADDYTSKNITEWSTTSKRTDIQDLKILLYITTLYSTTHRNYLHCCWPKLLKESRLLKHADVLIFSNNLTAIENNNDENILDYSRSLFQQYNPSVKFQFASERDLQPLRDFGGGWDFKQYGANMAVQLGFSQGWFAEYDWVIRINPDVLIRQSDFIMEHMQDDAVDGIFALCGSKLNTDFFVVRPSAVQNHSAAFAPPPETNILNAELTARRNFQHILDQKRARHMPDLDPMLGKCRVRGERAPVYHAHDSCLNTSMICDALEGWKIT